MTPGKSRFPRWNVSLHYCISDFAQRFYVFIAAQSSVYIIAFPPGVILERIASDLIAFRRPPRGQLSRNLIFRDRSVFERRLISRKKMSFSRPLDNGMGRAPRVRNKWRSRNENSNINFFNVWLRGYPRSISNSPPARAGCSLNWSLV